MRPWKPRRKVAASFGGAGLAATIIWVGEQAGVEIPAPVAAYIATLAGGILGWLIPDTT